MLAREETPRRVLQMKSIGIGLIAALAMVVLAPAGAQAEPK